MNKMVLFLVIIVLAVLGFVIMLNKNSTNTQEKTSLTSFISPTPNPTSMPIQTDNSSTSSTLASSTSSAQVQATKATIKTSKGEIVLLFYNNDAPKTIENFVSKAKSGYYNNLTFHRVEDWVIQGGDPLGNGTGGGNMPVEFNSKPFVVGSLGIASRGDGKVQNDSQFFITKTDASWLNGKYTNFGIVSAGMDVVDKISIGDKILEIIVE